MATKLSLVGPGTMPQIWQRHILDSAQLMPLVKPETGAIMDIGSGAGFPAGFGYSLWSTIKEATTTGRIRWP